MTHFNELNAAVLKLTPYTLATLPASTAATAGFIAATTTTASPTVAVPVFNDGTAWKLITIGATAA
jgi:hypothetical protein